ncbi:FixH family protein [Actinokineospora pegani]|uniref:FixH family protein n=1 Tax=Actinokineospora pegani TaxID=2654637 RepID=UPI0012EAB258|nr:FixH family protein [Actinokineospora pegani]
MLRRALTATLLLGVLLLCGAGTVAVADGGPVGADLHIAQTLGAQEFTVVVRRVDGAPAPVVVDVFGHSEASTDLRLRTLSAGREHSRAALTVSDGPASTRLDVDSFGAWELEISDGEHTGLIPFTVPERITPAWERFTYGGFVGAGGFLLLSLGLAVRRGAGPAAAVSVAGVVVCLTVGVTSALLSATIPVAAPPLDGVRPPVNMAVEQTADNGVVLRLTDGSTGLPVDDLRVEHAALIHLTVVTPDGDLLHLHPVRTAPGAYAATIPATTPGRHALAAELSRAGAGVQQVRSSVELAGRSPRPAPAAADLDVGEPVAGQPARLTADFGGAADLQPWLGMRGHLVVVGPLRAGPVGAAALEAPVWAHGHAMVDPTPGAVGGTPDESVAAYEPVVDFTFTFPQPGRYRAWFQAERDYRVLTAATDIQVGERTSTAAGFAISLDSAGLSTRDPAVTVSVTGAGGAPVDGAEVSLTAVMPEMGHATRSVRAGADGPGRYRAAAAGLSMPGGWEFTVTVRKDGAERTAVFPVRVDP